MDAEKLIEMVKDVKFRRSMERHKKYEEECEKEREIARLLGGCTSIIPMIAPARENIKISEETEIMLRVIAAVIKGE
ncbi:MAG: hypothetical protein NUV49_04335 [Patescibacteria group bacterium]|nr:hypothetical protein [Patescibacteria group bacterium]